jgi:hypothetical protein
VTRGIAAYPLVVVVAGLCLAAAILDSPQVGIVGGHNEMFGWYFLAMGLFCPLSLLLSRAAVLALRERRQALFSRTR